MCATLSWGKHKLRVWAMPSHSTGLERTVPAAFGTNVISVVLQWQPLRQDMVAARGLPAPPIVLITRGLTKASVGRWPTPLPSSSVSAQTTRISPPTVPVAMPFLRAVPSLLGPIPRKILGTIVDGRTRRRQGAATEVAGVLRRGGLSVDLVLEARKTKANFKHAARVGASHAIMVAPAEWKAGKASPTLRPERWFCYPFCFVFFGGGEGGGRGGSLVRFNLAT